MAAKRPKKPTPAPEPAPKRPPEKAKGDLFVSLGNLQDTTIADLRAVLARGDAVVMSNYEDLVEDFIETFNHAVTQGVPPQWALFAFTQAYALTMGQCLVADLPFTEAAKFLRTIIENADLSQKFVKQVSLIVTPGTKQ